ncbi:site-specific tyrosine recombinase/integron integrase [Aureivirga sp. CE67]|uniref:site-specific tyrosine recombinase/integron integrase n=1 Tax=Aureivirga sp. CE67 TaxID=1788983 RepID=UPI0018CA3B58|nr:site-specific tyrosine recombinase/integron integrase [Aureivirga sp. CE67]
MIKYKTIDYQDVKMFSIQIPFEKKWTILLKSKPKTFWNPDLKCWLMPYSQENKEFLTSLTDIVSTSSTKLKTAIFYILKGNKLRFSCYPTPKGIEYIKSLGYYHYDSTSKQWTIPYHENIKNRLNEILATTYEITYIDQRIIKEKPTSIKKELLVEHLRECPQEMKNRLIEMRYSASTIKSYTSVFSTFLSYYHQYQPKEITSEMIRSYLRYLIQEKEISESYQNIVINAIKFYYEKVLGGKQTTYFIERPRKSRSLPEVLSETEIIKLLKGIQNLKHKAIVSLLYSTGMRLGELLSLRIKDVDFEKNRIHIKNAKGKKDRYVPLSKRVKIVIKIYLDNYFPEQYVFEGVKGGVYSSTSVQKLVKRYAKNAGIEKNVTPHKLRHSFATHLLEKGVAIRYIQHILGHESSKTTEIYTHITTVGLEKIKNPIDDFDFSD